MFTIAICDDNEAFCEALKNMILEQGEHFEQSICVALFYSGNALCKAVERGALLDLIFLDIQMDGLDGVWVGKKIRRLLQGERVAIVYISSSEERAMELFQNQPMDFLLKPLETSKITEIIKRVWKTTEKQNIYFEYRRKNEVVRIKIKDILYLESHLKKVHVICADQVHEYYGSLNEAEAELKNSNQFLRIHKGYLINAEKIATCKREVVRMENGQELPISQANRTRIYKAVFDK